MDNNINKSKAKKENHSIVSRLLTAAVMLFVALMIAELYLIKRIPDNYLVIIGVGILAVIDVFLLVDEIAKVINRNYKQKMLQMEEFMKSQKAIYLANKRGFESITEKLEEIEKSNQEAIDNLFTGQKTIGKTIIKKNMESLNDIRTAIATKKLEIPKELTNTNKEKEDSTYNVAFDIEQLKQAIVEAINNVSEECTQIKNECTGIKEVSATLIDKLDTLKIDEPFIKTESNESSAAIDSEPVQMIQESDESQDLLKQMGIDSLDDLPDDEDTIFNQDILDEEAILDSVNDSEYTEALADIQDDESIEQALENEAIIEPIEASGEEIIEESIEISEESIEKMVEEPNSMELEAEPSAAAGPDLSDPNKQMTADEIAALFAALQ